MSDDSSTFAAYEAGAQAFHDGAKGDPPYGEDAFKRAWIAGWRDAADGIYGKHLQNDHEGWQDWGYFLSRFFR